MAGADDDCVRGCTRGYSCSCCSSFSRGGSCWGSALALFVATCSGAALSDSRSARAWAWVVALAATTGPIGFAVNLIGYYGFSGLLGFGFVDLGAFVIDYGVGGVMSVLQVVYMREHASVFVECARGLRRPSLLEAALIATGFVCALIHAVTVARASAAAPAYFVISGFCWFLSSLCAGLYACTLLDGGAAVVVEASARVAAASATAAAAAGAASATAESVPGVDAARASSEARAVRAVVEDALLVAFARKRGAQSLAHCIFGAYVLHLTYGVACAVSGGCDPGYFVFAWMSVVAWRVTISASRLCGALCGLYERCVRAGPHTAADSGLLMQCLFATGQLAISVFGFSVTWDNTLRLLVSVSLVAMTIAGKGSQPQQH